MVYARDAGQIVTASVATGNSGAVAGADLYAKHQADVATTGGTWRVWWETSPDGGSTWITASDTLTLSGTAPANSGIVATTFFARTARLRWVRDIAAGQLDAWLIQDDDTPNGAR